MRRLVCILVVALAFLYSRAEAQDSRVERIQTALETIGYDVGTIDGAMGPRTRAAVREFQYHFGLDATGRLSESDFAYLIRIYELTGQDGLLILDTDAKIEAKDATTVFESGGAVFPKLPYANGWHYAAVQPGTYYNQRNRYEAKLFETQSERVKRLWDKAYLAATNSRDPFKVALVLLDKSYDPPDFETMILPAIDRIIEAAKANSGNTVFAHRVFASFKWHFSNDQPCANPKVAKRALATIDRALALFEREKESLPEQGYLLKLAAICAEAEAADYLERRSGLASDIGGKFHVIALRDEARHADRTLSSDRAKALYAGMYKIMAETEAETWIEAYQQSVLGIDDVRRMYHLGLENVAKEAGAAVVAAYTDQPVDNVFSATIQGDMQGETLGYISGLLVETRNTEQIKNFSRYLTQNENNWAAASMGIAEFLTVNRPDAAADGAAFFAILAQQDGDIQSAVSLAVQEAQARLELGHFEGAEKALTQAVAWSSDAPPSAPRDQKIRALQSQLKLKNLEIIGPGAVLADALTGHYNELCKRYRNKTKGTLPPLEQPEIDFASFSDSKAFRAALAEGGVLGAMLQCGEDWEEILYNARLFCGLSVETGQTERAVALFQNTLKSPRQWYTGISLEQCAFGLADTGNGDLLQPYAGELAAHKEMRLLYYAALPSEKRDQTVVQDLVHRPPEPIDAWNADPTIFLSEMNPESRSGQLAEFRNSYIILNSGASARASEVEYARDQAFELGLGYLKLGLPRVAEAYFSVDDTVEIHQLAGRGQDAALSELSNDRALRLIRAHAEVARALGDTEKTAAILEPSVSAALGQMTRTDRALPSMVEQYSARVLTLLQYWLDVQAWRSENAGQQLKVHLVQQSVALAKSTASLSEIQQRLKSGNPDKVRQYQDLQRALRAATGATGENRNQSEIARLASQFKALEIEILNSGASLSSHQIGVLATLDETQASLAKAGAVLMVATELEDSYLIRIVSGETVMTRKTGLTPAELKTQIDILRAGIEESTTAEDGFDYRLARQLYDDLIGWAFTDGPPSDLRLVLDGGIAAMPFAALRTGDSPNDWLGVQTALRVSPSIARAIQGAGVAPSAGEHGPDIPFLGFGAPEFGAPKRTDETSGTRTSKLAPLPETEGELRFMALALGANPIEHVFVGQTATEETINRLSLDGRLGQARIVSFATHGLLSGAQGGNRDASLALSAPAAHGQGDGFLTASEIFGLKLRADVVILSACNTGVAGADSGLSDLASSFFYAGANALVVSHWEIDSGATVEFMKFFAQELRTSGHVATSTTIRNTILLMIKDGSKFAHPKFWAGFFVVA